MDNEHMDEVIQLVRDGQWISAIKAVRYETGWQLIVAKNFVMDELKGYEYETQRARIIAAFDPSEEWKGSIESVMQNFFRNNRVDPVEGWQAVVEFGVDWLNSVTNEDALDQANDARRKEEDGEGRRWEERH